MPRTHVEGDRKDIKADHRNSLEESDSTNYTDELDRDANAGIEWSNLIFLPFHPVFKLAVLVCVVTKTLFGPIQAVHSFIDCWDSMDKFLNRTIMKFLYVYICDYIYGLDTVLHIAHRQVTDKATRRQYRPKSMFLILLDILSLIPFMRFMLLDKCPEISFWPNILGFNELLIIYRVWEYFSLVSSHSYLNLLLGCSLLSGISISGMACFYLLLTNGGLCDQCNKGIFDWRIYIQHKLNEYEEGFTTYVYACAYITSLTINKHVDEFKPSTIIEFLMMSLLIIISYTVFNFGLVPKLFFESTLRHRQEIGKYPTVAKILEETKTRNPDPAAVEDVDKYLNLVWTKHNGILELPDFFKRITPRYLRLEMKEDLLWQIFYHSPTLRNTSDAFQHWLCEEIYLHYKLPGEKLYSNADRRNNCYYLKSGVIQIISAEDGISPILSVTSGTILGDVNFLLPHYTCDIVIRCLTYCEIYIITRGSFLKGMNKFELDRFYIRRSVKARIEHARSLYDNKKRIVGLDRKEHEGISWIKKRWWEMITIIQNSKQKIGLKYRLPTEETRYHCPKYLGQLVLCGDEELRENAMFVNVKFPWVLSPNSNFIIAWRKIVSITVYMVLFIYPANLTRRLEGIPTWFEVFCFWTDLIYIVDIAISLLTATKVAGVITTTFSEVMFVRCKSLNFILDVLATIWFEDLVAICGYRQYYYGAKFNRLIKIYLLFYGEKAKWGLKDFPAIKIAKKIFLLQICHIILISHLIYELGLYYTRITFPYFFGDGLCLKKDVTKTKCVNSDRIFGVSLLWYFEFLYSDCLPAYLDDIYISLTSAIVVFIINTYCRGLYISYLYATHIKITNYRDFVRTVIKYYEQNEIHQDLLLRLNRHFKFHWKYFKGMDIMKPNRISEEPVEIIWRCRGEVAENIIKNTLLFKNANASLIRDIAQATKTIVVPERSSTYLFGTEGHHFVWILRGFVEAHYHDNDGNFKRRVYQPRNNFNTLPLLFKKAAIITYTTYTDCEFIYIAPKEFFNIFKRYPVEWSYLQRCIKEFESKFEEVFLDNLVKHRAYQQKIKMEEILMDGLRMAVPIDTVNKLTTFNNPFWGAPNSSFMKKWLVFRMLIVIISITIASLQSGVVASYYWTFNTLEAFCDCVAWIDIVFKICLNYYDSRGVLITDRQKCFLHYASRGLLIDLVGTIPLYAILRVLFSIGIEESEIRLINWICKFLHIYIVIAYFNHLSDKPTANMIWITIVKWQLINILILLGASNYLIVRCIKLEYNTDHTMLLNVTLRENCWMPPFLKLPPKIGTDHFRTIIAESFNLAQLGMMGMNAGHFYIDRSHFGIALILLILGTTGWLVMCHNLAVIVLASRSNTLFQNGVNQLVEFLTYERIDNKTISNAVIHFRYCWMRTKGLNMQQLTNERLGLVFGQDLSYYVFKQTFSLLDLLFKGGEQLQRRLAGVSQQRYYLPDQDIMREMQLTSKVFIIHRGRVRITMGGKKVAVLSKGDIFGQLRGSKRRPVHILAQAEDYVDLLEIMVETFHSTITDEVKEKINNDPHSKINFMKKKKTFIENPYDTVNYIMRERKKVKLPWSKHWTEGHQGTWYSYWLYVAWLFGPFTSAFISTSIGFVSSDVHKTLYIILILLDSLHFANFILDFFTVRYLKHKLVYSHVGLHRMRKWQFYYDLVTLVVPLFTLLDGDWRFQLAKLMRLIMFYDFKKLYCQSFKSVLPRVFLKVCIMALTLHFCACAWIYVSCRYDLFPIAVPPIHKNFTKNIDYTEWMHPNERPGGGCAKITSIFKKTDRIIMTNSYIVPRQWYADYILAMSYVLLLLTHYSVDLMLPLEIRQAYCKVVIAFIIYLLDLWIMSVAMNVSLAYLRDLYCYDYTVQLVSTYFEDRGICKYLLDRYRMYCRLLWDRHKGGMWLPDLVQKGPPCLRQDIFSALYIHHLNTAPSLEILPDYFKRQLVARVERVVVYPGKYITREGDTHSALYFIHEGEIECWSVGLDGENKLQSILYTNGYFGLVPGVFDNDPYQFSFYSRTVVDLLVLHLDKWKDLLEAYPDVKKTLYEATENMKLERRKSNFGRTMMVKPSTIFKNTRLLPDMTE